MQLSMEELRSGIVDEMRSGIRDQVSTVSVLMERLYWGRKGQGGERGKDGRGAERYRTGDQLRELVGTGNKRSSKTDGRKTVIVAKEFSAEVPMSVSYGWRVGDILLYDADKSANATGVKIFELLSTRIKSMTEGLMQDVAEDLFRGKKLKGANGGNANDFDGLGEVVDDGNTYGTINRSLADNAFFGAKVVRYPVTNSLLTLDKIDALHGTLTKGIKVRPTVQITTDVLYRGIKSQIRSTNAYIETDPKLADWSIEHVLVNGSPVLPDIYCPEGEWYHLNEDALMMYVDPAHDFSIGEWQPVVGIIDGQAGMVVHAQQMFTKVSLCLYCPEPRLQGRHIGLTVAS